MKEHQNLNFYLQWIGEGTTLTMNSDRTLNTINDIADSTLEDKLSTAEDDVTL